ncbi:MAG: gamma-glutamyl-gamma-aminobutyrate hydrolase family protein [Caldimicrobium sp.]|nr:gamma-glutamyl-gamma-aminobutyrate hydrolase family protein [Caldimicrobium sp.]MCX7874194.1 gamma-glutamyl-gamma-aminobutyrate hydrolase family protein [Caldimicrobium sp.]MDW8093802.1 gamma-glutamyl-gamma-aminobutyrate hydrolase family protein [Caldimicrobium sp.]
MKVLAVRHVEIEHLGVLERVLPELGYTFEYLDTPKGERLRGPLEEYSALIVLGGYMGAYEEAKYDFLSYGFKLIEEALKVNKPFLGICLGAQMLAKVLGSKVYPGEKGKEIGWLEVFKVADHPYFEAFPQKLKVFQWHGDTFELPQGAIRVFSSELYENQGFVYGRAVGLQFHLEVDREIAVKWAKLYRDEIEEEGISILTFDDITPEEGNLLYDLSKDFLRRWLFK